MVRHTVIGDSLNQPDTVFLVKWKKLQDFLDMVTDNEYRKISKDRTISIEYGGLWACEEEEEEI